MIRKIKTLALAGFAVLALSALTAAGANAAEFTASAYPAAVSGTQPAGENHTFTYQGRQVTCDTAVFVSEELNGPSSELTVTPTYEECHAVVLGVKLPATVTFDGCDYNFTAAAATAEAQVHLNCETGKDVQIHIYNVLGGHSPDNEVCTYTVQPQTVGGIVYHNNGDGSVTVTANSSVATTRVQGAALTCGSASGTSTYAGDTVVKGTAGQSVDVG